jgi:hypothetical protein
MHNKMLIDVGEPTVNIAYTIYREALRNSGQGYLITKFSLDKVMTDLGQARALSEYAKKKGTVVDENWRSLVDLHRLRDYLPYAADAEFVEDIKDWVQRKPLHTWNGDERKWYHKFREKFREVLRRGGKRPDKVTSIDEFIENGDIWCTSGSGFEPDAGKLKVYNLTKKSEVEVKKNKWSVRWSLSNYKIKRLIFKKRHQRCKAVQKSEPGKVRAVISSDLALYLKMSYVSTFLEKIFRGRKDSTLFMDADARFELWQKMAYDGTQRMPLDQSEFDRNVSFEQITIMLEEIKYFLVDMQAPADILEVMDLIIYALSGGYVIIGGVRIPIHNGVLSGWRWTALLDTLVNLTELAMAQEWVRENSVIPAELVDYNAQGDDDWLKINRRDTAIALWLAYESFGLFVNPGKFFLDTRRDEYLRRVYDKGKITGYPARSITSIAFRNPVSEKETVGADRIRQSLTKWKLFSERLDVNFDGSWFFKKWQQDAVQGTRGITKQEVVAWFNQSAWVGGLGYDCPPVNDSPVPGSSFLVRDPIQIDADGYNEWVKFASKYAVSERDCLRFASSTLEFGNSKLAPWVRYIISSDKIEAGIPVGLDWDVPGSIAVGLSVRARAKARGIKWYPSLTRAKSNSHYENWEFELPKYVADDFKLSHINKSRNSHKEVLMPGISLTLAQLSSEPALVWQNYNESLFLHKPRSWTRDFLSGKLKKFTSIRSGWGMDAVGYISGKLFNTCVNIFLGINRPSISLWNSLLASADAAVPRYLALLPVRVVE